MSMTKGLKDYFAGKYGKVDPDEEIALVWYGRDDIEYSIFGDDDGEFTPDEWKEIADTFNMDCHQDLTELIHEIARDVLARREVCELDYDPRIKKMSKKGKQILAHMTNSYETATHDDFIDHNNVHTLPENVVRKTLAMASKERILSAKQRYELALIKKELGEKE